MLIEITDNLFDLAEMYLERRPIDMLEMAKVEDAEYNVTCLPVKLLFQPSEPESILTVKRTKFICVDLDAGDEFCEYHTNIYIPKKYVDHPRTIFAVFIDGIWVDQYWTEPLLPSGAVFRSKREAEEYVHENQEFFQCLGVK